MLLDTARTGSSNSVPRRQVNEEELGKEASKLAEYAPETEMRARIQAAAAVLIGKALWICRRAADTATAVLLLRTAFCLLALEGAV